MRCTGSDIDLIFDDLPLINDRRGKGFLIGNVEAEIHFYSANSWTVRELRESGVALDKDDDRALWSLIVTAITETQSDYVEREIREAMDGARYDYDESRRDEIADLASR